MKTVYIGSANPVKISCTQKGFEAVMAEAAGYQFVGIAAPSGVSAQPMSNEETLLGAENRANYLKRRFPEGDFYVGIEGGVQKNGSALEAFAWIVIIFGNTMGRSQTATFQLPPAISTLIGQGVELGHADDMVFKRNNSKQGNGAVGLLTNNVIDRVEYYRHAVILALIPILQSRIYSEDNG
ncbi:MAG: DUF84 family protein [Cyclobacteriaceae bacterium]|nr:DUF84 family protein [Cyclobacteriaceae bacterium]